MKHKDTFRIMTQAALSSDEWKVLGLLYQPIIGVLAFSLYHTFYHLLSQKNYQSEEFTNQFLIDLLNVKIDSLKEAKERLEAINLLSSFKDQNKYVYQLKSPLSPRGFLKDTVLGQFLLSEIGPSMYKNLTNIFKVNPVDLTGYVESTKNFDDVFKFESLDQPKDSSMYLGRKNNSGTKISNQIDYELFLEHLPDRFKKGNVMDLKVQDTIQKLVFIYQFSLDEMIKIYCDTVNDDGFIDTSRLSLKASMFYQVNNKLAKPVVKNSVEPNGVDEFVKYLNEVSPIRILEKYAKNDYQMMNTDTVMQLLERNQVEVGMINALLLHILKYKNGDLPNITYLEKVLETWMSRGVKTTKDAYIMILNNDQPVRKQKQTFKDQKENSPDWVQAYLKQLEDKVED